MNTQKTANVSLAELRAMSPEELFAPAPSARAASADARIEQLQDGISSLLSRADEAARAEQALGMLLVSVASLAEIVDIQRGQLRELAARVGKIEADEDGKRRLA